MVSQMSHMDRMELSGRLLCTLTFITNFYAVVVPLQCPFGFQNKKILIKPKETIQRG